MTADSNEGYPRLDSGPHIVGHLRGRVESLTNALERAQDRINELERAIGIGDDLMPLRMLGLSPQQARLVNAMRKRGVLTRTQALMAVYDENDDRRFDVLPKILDVIVSNTRKTLARFGISFETMRGLDNDGGYYMRGPDKSRLAKLLATGARSGVSMRRAAE